MVSRSYHNYNYSYYYYCSKKAGYHTVAVVEHKQQEAEAEEERVDLVVEAAEVMDAERWLQTHSLGGEVLEQRMKMAEVVEDTVEDGGDDDGGGGGGGAGDGGRVVAVYSI